MEGLKKMVVNPWNGKKRMVQGANSV